jgi:hypothetical protein
MTNAESFCKQMIAGNSLIYWGRQDKKVGVYWGGHWLAQFICNHQVGGSSPFTGSISSVNKVVSGS